MEKSDKDSYHMPSSSDPKRIDREGNAKASEKKREVAKKMSPEVKSRKIAGQMNHIVNGHYFNDKKAAQHFANTGKTLPGHEAR